MMPPDNSKEHMYLAKEYNGFETDSQGPVIDKRNKMDIATKGLWMIQRYLVDIPPKIPKTGQKPTLAYQHGLFQTQLLQHIINTYNLQHSYYSSPLSCPIGITKYFNPHHRNLFFGSTRLARRHKWMGRGYAHFHNAQLATKARHWVQIAAQHTPNSPTILLIPRTDWIEMALPYNISQTDIQLLAPFGPSQLQYHPIAFHTAQ